VNWSHYAKIGLIGIFISTPAFADKLQNRAKNELKKILEIEKSCSENSLIHPIIAVIDTGIDIDHPDLKNALWINPKEIPNNGKDDDGNGYVDDIHGWNFTKNNNDLSDSHGHGTHISGIIASQNKDADSIRGIAPCARLMILKYYDAKATPQQNLIHTLEALNYAIRMKAEIINYSGGGPGKNPMEEKLIREASDKNILLVAAAGNESSNTDLIPFYPASYNLPNTLAVTSVADNGGLAYYGNYGKKSVNIAAPGDGIYSTLPAGFGKMSGTSQATAFATGGAALIIAETRAQGLTLRPQELIEKILATSVVNGSLKNKTKTGAELSLYRAVAMKDRGITASGFATANFRDLNAKLFTVGLEQ
jgi:thermitase